MSRKKNIDTTDILILNQIQRDANITNRSLAAQFGLTPGPMLTRVKNLFRKGALERVVGKINYTYFGYNYRAMVVARIPKEHAQSFSSLLRGLEFVLTAHRLKSPNSLSTMQTVMFEVVAKNEALFVGAMAKQYNNLNYSVDFEIFPVEAVVKDVTEISLTIEDVG